MLRNTISIKLFTYAIIIAIGGITSFAFCYRSDGLFSYRDSVVIRYLEKFTLNGYFPFFQDESIHITKHINPSYPAVYLFVDEQDLPYLLQEKQKDKMIYVHGIEANMTVPWNATVDQQYFFSSMNLRGVTSLTCPKPSFRLENAKIKLKSMCGSDYGLEEIVFSRSFYDNAAQYEQPIATFFGPHDLTNVFVNGVFYGVYSRVPQLGKSFFHTNWLRDVSPKNSCIFKTTNLITRSTNIHGLPVLTTLEALRNFSEKDLALVAAVKYGPPWCYAKFYRLISYLQNNDLSNIDEQLIDRLSVLDRWLTNWLSQTLLSYEHNYLILFHHWKYYMWFWDNEAFRGCLNFDYHEYRNQPHQNLLFSRVLAWYQKNDPDFVDERIKIIAAQLCDSRLFFDVQSNDLPYVLFDRYLWNVGHYTLLDHEKRAFNRLLKDVFYKSLDFSSYLETMKEAFDRYFVSLEPTH